MKITEVRAEIKPPVEKYILELTPGQMKMLCYFAMCAPPASRLGAASFIKATENLDCTLLPLDWNTRF